VTRDLGYSICALVLALVLVLAGAFCLFVVGVHYERSLSWAQSIDYVVDCLLNGRFLGNP